MQRTGTPEDVVALVSYLVSDQAQFVTGQSVRLLHYIKDATYLSTALHRRSSSMEA
jgi:NAD(P)-dependent dehydrogenase (short-subunit alcohol dehydrogenase family)